MLQYTNNRILACIELLHSFTVFIWLRIHVKDVSVNPWLGLPDNEANLVVLGPWPPTGAQGVQNCQ